MSLRAGEVLLEETQSKQTVGATVSFLIGFLNHVAFLFSRQLRECEAVGAFFTRLGFIVLIFRGFECKKKKKGIRKRVK